ncbi:MAG: ribonuclease J, partial [Erysipelotrichaceae bacterium]
LIVRKENFSNDLDNIVVVVSGSGSKVFNRMHRIAINEESDIELRDSDMVIIASPSVPGTEKEAVNLENDLYNDDVCVKSVTRKQVYSMHPSSEDLKMMTFFLKPRYYIPIKGEYCQLISNANLALDHMGFTANNILVLDNGQQATFVDGQLQPNFTNHEIVDVMIDGTDNLDSFGMVLRDRQILSKDGVMIIGIALDNHNKKIIANPDIQTRGLIYLKDSEYIIKELVEMTRNIVQEMVNNNEYTNANCRLEIKENASRYISKETGKRPMILPMIIEVR